MASKRAALLALLLAALLSACTAPTPQSQGSTTGETQGIAKPAGAFNADELALIPPAKRTAIAQVCGVTLSGDEACIPGDAGKAMLINVWASWCAPCLREMPDLVAIHKQYTDLEVLGINNKDSLINAKQFVREHAISFDSLLDEDGALAFAFGAHAPKVLPSTILIDRHGRVALTIVGAVNPATLEPIIEQLLAES